MTRGYNPRPQKPKGRRVPLRDKFPSLAAATNCRRCNRWLEQQERAEGFCRDCLRGAAYWPETATRDERKK